MHHGAGKDAGTALAEQLGDAARRVDLLGCGQHERARRAEPRHFVGQLPQRTRAEHDAWNMGFEAERFHRGYHAGICASTLTQTLLTWVYSRIASKPISRP